MKKNSNLKNKAHDKIYSKIQTLVNEIRADQFDIDNGLATKFVPKELHISALNFKKREKKIYEYILNLINEKRET
jgi:Txe/YoeB family toxin of Txe-Axe toxin-antitoxin module